ncbi:MAG: hypothetical protein K8S23_09330 [Candidatus Cloacimonetes bacterium]|nr:hypothetical protein [Candidatus Cloacimonadota bacterium]
MKKLIMVVYVLIVCFANITAFSENIPVPVKYDIYMSKDVVTIGDTLNVRVEVYLDKEHKNYQQGKEYSVVSENVFIGDKYRCRNSDFLKYDDLMIISDTQQQISYQYTLIIINATNQSLKLPLIVVREIGGNKATIIPIRVMSRVIPHNKRKKSGFLEMKIDETKKNRVNK